MHSLQCGFMRAAAAAAGADLGADNENGRSWLLCGCPGAGLEGQQEVPRKDDGQPSHEAVVAAPPLVRGPVQVLLPTILCRSHPEQAQGCSLSCS